MGESGNRVCWLTEREQVVLGRSLHRAEAKGRDDRGKKARAFGSIADGGFGLGWVRDTLEAPLEESIQIPDLLAEFNAGVDPAVAMSKVANRVVGLAMRDPFTGRKGKTPIKMTPAADVLAWTLDTLNTLPSLRNQQGEAIGNPDDLMLADLEDRFLDAKRGTCAMPSELQTRAPELDIVPPTGDMLASVVDDMVSRSLGG